MLDAKCNLEEYNLLSLILDETAKLPMWYPHGRWQQHAQLICHRWRNLSTKKLIEQVICKIYK